MSELRRDFACRADVRHQWQNSLKIYVFLIAFVDVTALEGMPNAYETVKRNTETEEMNCPPSAQPGCGSWGGTTCEAAQLWGDGRQCLREACDLQVTLARPGPLQLERAGRQRWEKKVAGRESGGKRKRRSELLLAAGRQGNLYKAHGQESGQQVFTSELRCGRSWVLWGKGGRWTSSSLRGRGMFSSPFVCWRLEYCVRDGEEKSRVRSSHF